MLEKRGIIQKIQNKPRIFVSVVVIMMVFVVVMLIGRSEDNNHRHMEEARRIISRHYPHFNKYDENTTVYEFVLVADQDKISKVDDKNYETILKTGKIIRNGEDYRVEFTGDRYLYSQYSVGGRGMELSELCFFNGKLLSVSDKTGLVVEIENNNIIPIHILSDGDGRSSKGFKAEWCTVKGDTLYVGSTGQEWYDEDGKISNRNNVFVKTIEKNGKITHVDWSEIYGEIKRASNITKGYITHEAANWNPLTKRWYFLPRKISNEPFNHSNDEDMGNNLLISMDENFKDTKTIEIGKYHESHGYSTFKFLPFHTEIAVGLKTEEHGSKTHTDIVIFHINGTVLMDEVFVGDVKFEGIEII